MQTDPFRKRLMFFSVGLPRTVCSFVYDFIAPEIISWKGLLNKDKHTGRLSREKTWVKFDVQIKRDIVWGWRNEKINESSIIRNEISYIQWSTVSYVKRPACIFCVLDTDYTRFVVELRMLNHKVQSRIRINSKWNISKPSV